MRSALHTIGLTLLLMPLHGHTEEIYASLPDEINPDQRYVFYSHGMIVEGDDPRPRHPTFGVYDFPAIKEALFADGRFNLIAQHRPAGADLVEHVSLLESWVRKLIGAGVAPSRITLVGFSLGAHLTAHASTQLNGTGINTAIMATCSDGGIGGGAPISLGGRVLSIYETSDVPGSCSKLADGPYVAEFREMSISTGLSHGAFYNPMPEWLVPLKEWIAETNR